MGWSYIHNGISYTGKIPSLYWISPQRDNMIFLISSDTDKHRSFSIYVKAKGFYKWEKTSPID